MTPHNHYFKTISNWSYYRRFITLGVLNEYPSTTMKDFHMHSKQVSISKITSFNGTVQTIGTQPLLDSSNNMYSAA